MSFVRTPARLAAAGALAAFALAGAPSAATADPLSGATGAVGLVRPVADTASTVVLQRDGDVVKYPAQLLQLQRGAELVPGYSLSPNTMVRRSSPFSDSIAPSALSADKLQKITWILASVPAAGKGLPAVPGVGGGLPSLPAGVPALPAVGGGLPGGLPGGVPAVGGGVPAVGDAVPAVAGGVPGLAAGGVPSVPVVGTLPSAPNLSNAVPVLGLPKGLPNAQRAAATQAAIWHYSAGTDLVPGRNLPAVVALYRLLTGPANTGLALPSPTLMSAPDADAFGNVRGTAGELLGPFTVDPALKSVAMSLDGPAGLRMVDAARKPISTFRGGQRFFLDVPRSAQPGEAVLTAVGTPQAALGRVLRGVTTGDPGQMLVVADRRALPAEQMSVVRWGASGLSEGVGAAATCVPEGIGVELDNARRATALNALVDHQPVTVPAGATKVVPVRVPEGEHYSIPVSDGTRTTQLTGVRNCAGPAHVLTAAPDCASGGMGVSFVNDDALRDAVYSVNGQAVRVARQSTKTVRVPAAEGKDYSIQVLGENGFTRAFNGVRNCSTQARLAAADTAAAPKAGAAALPITGAALGGVIVGGLALLGAGVAAVMVTRRRRRALL